MRETYTAVHAVFGSARFDHSQLLVFFFFFFKYSAAPRDLPSSPPRRSSDPGRARGPGWTRCTASTTGGAACAGRSACAALLPRQWTLTPLAPRRRPDDPDPSRMLVDARAKDRKSTRLNSSHLVISYAVFCL